MPHTSAAARCLALATLLVLSSACVLPGTVRPTVKIGLVAPFEGRYRYVGYDAIYGVRLALLEANDAATGGPAGVSGYGVELVAYDDGGHPAAAAEQARKLAVDPDVVAAIGHFREGTTAAAVDAYAEAGIPLVAPTALDPELAFQGTVWVPGPTAAPISEALLDRAAAVATADEIFLVGNDGALASALRLDARERDAHLYEASASVDGWERDVLARDLSLALLALDPVRGGEVLAALRGAGWEGQALGGPALAASDFAAVAGPAAVGTLFVTPWPFPRDLVGGEPFVAAYRETSDGIEPGPYALPAYEATWLVLRSLERAAEDGQPTRAAVSAALPSAAEEQTLGQSGVNLGLQTDRTLYWYRIGSDAVPHRLEAGDE